MDYDPTYLRIVALTIFLEGGDQIVDDPDDPGGLTKWGISKRSYPNLNIRELTKEQAIAIYYEDFWLAMKCNELRHFQVCFELFDTAVNCGVHTAKLIVQRALNFFGEGLDEDGVFGPKTLAGLRKWIDKDPRALFKALNGEQYIHYKGCKQKYHWGWMKRIQEYRDVG